MNLADGFARRKQIDVEIENWTNRLAIAGRDTLTFQTKAIEGKEAFVMIPGSKKEFFRNYTIEECQAKIQSLIEEDRILAQKISLTNQTAKAKLIDLDGKEKIMTIPELLVLRNEIAPKSEKAARAIPKLENNVERIDKIGKAIRWRVITPQYKKTQELSEKGNVISKEIIEYYQIDENTDYGLPERQIFDEIDRIHAWLERIRNAINEANKTPLL